MRFYNAGEPQGPQCGQGNGLPVARGSPPLAPTYTGYPRRGPTNWYTSKNLLGAFMCILYDLQSLRTCGCGPRHDLTDSVRLKQWGSLPYYG